MNKSALLKAALVGLVAVAAYFVGHRQGARGSNDEAARAGSNGLPTKTLRVGGGSESRLSTQATSDLGSPGDRIRELLRIAEDLEDQLSHEEFQFQAYGLIRKMSVADVRTTLSELAASDASNAMRNRLESMLIRVWASQDAPGVVEYSWTLPNENKKFSAMHVGLTSWARTDFEAADSWYQKHRDEIGTREGQNLETNLLAILAEHDFTAALDRVDWTSDPMRGGSLFPLARAAGNDLERSKQLLDRVDAVEDQRVRVRTVAGLASSMAHEDPQQAARLLESWEWSDEVRDRFVQDIAKSWMGQDREGAMEWQQGLEDEGDRRVAVRGVFEGLFRHDAEEAAQWLSEQDESVKTDELCHSAASMLAAAGLMEEAMGYAARATAIDGRPPVAMMTYSRWMRSDPEAAAAWLESADPETQAVLESVNRSGGRQPAPPRPGGEGYTVPAGSR